MNTALISGPGKVAPSGDHYIYVGNYQPNAWGLYDMTGNVGEWCLDVYKEDLGTAFVLDPIGDGVVFESVNLVSDTVSITAYDHSTYSTTATPSYFTYNGNTYFPKFTASQYQGNASEGTAKVKYVAYGCRRVIRGVSSRLAERSSALNIPSTLPVLTSGIKYYRYQTYYDDAAVLKKTIKANYANKKYGFRLRLTIDE